MADGGIIFPINFTTNGDPVFENIKKGLTSIEQAIKTTTTSIGDFQKAFSLTDLTENLNTASTSFKDLTKSFSGALKAGKDVLSAARVQSGPAKADGTPDMRFRVNQIAAQSQGITGYVGNTVDRLGIFINKMGTVTSETGNVMGTMGQVAGSMGELSSNLGESMGSVGDLMGRLGTSMESMGGVTGSIGRVVGNVGDSVSGIGETLGGVGEVMNTLNEGLGSVGGLVGNIGKSMNGLGGIISTVGSGIKNIIPMLSGVGTAIMSIPGIGWIIAAIAAVVVAVKLLWDNSRSFREIIFSIWEVAQAVFYNIGVVITRVWELVIKPVAEFIWNLYSSIFLAIWEIANNVWTGISTGIQWLWSVFSAILTNIWGIISTVFTAVLDFASGVWNWIIRTFGAFGTWINDVLISPIRDAFSGIWNWITDLFNRIMDRVLNLIRPIRDLWNKIFSSDGMKDLKVAADEGKKKGGESFDKSQQEREAEKKKSKEDQPVRPPLKEGNPLGNGFKLPQTTTALPPVSPIGGVAATQVMNAPGNAAAKAGATQNVGNLNITKLVENLNIYNQNGTTMSKDSIITLVKEALLTAVADFSLVKAQ